jgi:hypothetical protein
MASGAPKSPRICCELKTLDNLAFLTKISLTRKVNRKKRGRLLVHGFKEFLVTLGAVHLVKQEFHRLNYAKLRQHFA